MAGPLSGLPVWLRTLGLASGVLALLLALAWAVVDRRAPAWLEHGLSELGIGALISAGGAGLPRPDLVVLRDVALHDPHDGRVVARVDRVEVRLALVGGVPRPVQITGAGGQVTLERSGDDIGYVRALEAVIDAVSDALDRDAAQDDERSDEDLDERLRPRSTWRAPPVEVHGLSLVFRAPGEATVTLPEVSTWLAISHEGVRVGITTGPAGIVLLDFDQRGLRAVRASGVPVGPVQTLLLDEASAAAVAALRPRGVLDLELLLGRAPDEHKRPTGHGVLRGARLHTAALPFAATSERIAFAIDGDDFRVESARVELLGGQADMGVAYDGSRTRLRVDAVDLPFRRELLALLPRVELLDEMIWQDGGRVELHLEIAVDEAGVSVTGSGGVLIESLSLGPEWPVVSDLVGRFQLTGNTLVLPEASGRCAGGVVRVGGTLRLADGHSEIALEVLDVDIEQLGLPPREGQRALSGWLQGALAWSGVPGRPGSGAGQFSVRGGNLWAIPVLDRVFGALRLADPGSSERHRLEVDFRTRGRTTWLDTLTIESDVVTLRGEGKLHFLRDLDVDIVPLRLPVAVLGDLFEYLQSQVLKVELRGTLAEPQVHLRPFKAVTEPIGGLLGWFGRLISGEPQGVHIVPSPDAAEPERDGNVDVP